MTPNTIEFYNQDSTCVLRITADRRIEVNEKVEVTEAAKKVLEAIGHLLPKRTWVGLTDAEINNHYQNQEWLDGVIFAENLLKEKNN